MNRPTGEQPERARHLAKPVIRKMRWPFSLVWLVPVFAAALAGYYYYEHFENRGTLITMKCADASGLRPGQTPLVHRGVAIGEVESCELSADFKQALVHIRLKRSDTEFAKEGAVYWIVRPEISMQEISGLATVFSGPYIEALPGTGTVQTEFASLQSPPIATEDGLRIVLNVPQLEHLQSDTPVYFRGIPVGVVEKILLSSDSASVAVHVFIRRAYSPLVRTNSQFWIVSGVDLKGGLFGIHMKVESLRALLSGGIAFATPEENIGAAAKDGEQFFLNAEPKKDWQEWAPKIKIEPDDAEASPATKSPPPAPQ